LRVGFEQHRLLVEAADPYANHGPAIAVMVVSELRELLARDEEGRLAVRNPLLGAGQLEGGSDGQLAASDVESALKGHDKDPKDRTLSVPVRIEAHYVEAGKEHRGGGTYTLRYRWQGGGLFGGRSLHLVGLSR
jgi:hypothetical protein